MPCRSSLARDRRPVLSPCPSIGCKCAVISRSSRSSLARDSSCALSHRIRNSSTISTACGPSPARDSVSSPAVTLVLRTSASHRSGAFSAGCVPASLSACFRLARLRRCLSRSATRCSCTSAARRLRASSLCRFFRHSFEHVFCFARAQPCGWYQPRHIVHRLRLRLACFAIPAASTSARTLHTRRMPPGRSHSPAPWAAGHPPSCGSVHRPEVVPSLAGAKAAARSA
jgi:hypothetical protein